MKTIILIALICVAIDAASADESHVFKPLFGPDKTILITNAEFSSQFGRRLIFKDLDSGARKAFDVTQVGDEAISTLKIDTAAAIAAQNKIDEQKKAVAESYAQQAAVIRARQKIEAEEAAKRAVEAAKQAKIEAELAEEKRKQDELHDIQMRAIQADINSANASAAHDRAAAGYLRRSP